MRKNRRKMLAAASAAAILAMTALAQASFAGQEAENKVGLTIAGAQEEETQAAEEEAKVGLAVAGSEEETAAPESEEAADDTQTVDVAEEEGADPASYETLETTGVGESQIVAVDVSGIVDAVMPSIVAITATSVEQVQDFFYGYTQEYEAVGSGSGVIIAESADELMIATNNHVVEDTKDLTVCFTVEAEDEEELVAPAVVKGTDKTFDLAVVAVKKSDIPKDVYSQLRIATLGSSGTVKVGEPALVIGNALGVGQTVTSGIISALERQVDTKDGSYTELQTDAAVNLGCSGGAVLNRRGEVIGITSAKATGDYAESMGYAIPIDTAIPVLEDLINLETRSAVEKHGYLGVTVVPISDEAQEMYNMPAGAFVYEVPEGSAAEAAGLKKGDIITSFDGRKIDSSDKLVSTVGLYEPGETVTLEVMSAENGEYVSREVEVTLQEGTGDEEETEAVEDGEAGEDGEEFNNKNDFEDYPEGDGFEGYEGGEDSPYGNEGSPYGGYGPGWFDQFFGNGGGWFGF